MNPENPWPDHSRPLSDQEAEADFNELAGEQPPGPGLEAVLVALLLIAGATFLGLAIAAIALC